MHRFALLLHARQDGRCFYCGDKLNLDEHYKAEDQEKPICVDHKTPKSGGGKDSLENCCLCCRWCNSSKGSKTATEFQKYMMPYLIGIVDRGKLSEINKYLSLEAEYRPLADKIREMGLDLSL